MNKSLPLADSMFLCRRTFVLAFVLLCVAFVPILFYAGLYASITPTACLLLGLFDHWAATLWVLLHIIVYVALFTGIGLLIHWLTRFLPWHSIRVAVLLIALSLPLVSSFARVLTYSSIRGCGGTYTFWEAISRLFERHRQHTNATPRSQAPAWECPCPGGSSLPASTLNQEMS